MRLLAGIFTIRTTDAVAACAFAALSTIFSPTWWLMSNLLNPYINMDALAGNGLNFHTLPLLVTQLRMLGTDVLFWQVLPILLLCLTISILYLFISGWLGQKALRLIINQFKKTTTVS